MLRAALFVMCCFFHDLRPNEWTAGKNRLRPLRPVRRLFREQRTGKPLIPPCLRSKQGCAQPIPIDGRIRERRRNGLTNQVAGQEAKYGDAEFVQPIQSGVSPLQKAGSV